MKIVLGSDHGGFDVKERVKAALAARDIEVEDLGCYDTTSVDYTDYANDVAERVSQGDADQGILTCTTGNGMAIAANRYPGVRAAICFSGELALAARTHNDANVLVLGAADYLKDTPERILEAWFGNAFTGEARHVRRLAKLRADGSGCAHPLTMADPDAAHVLVRETERQRRTLNFIASENYTSPAIREAQASTLTNKYAEGYPRKRWYQGCAPTDDIEQLAIDRACELFGAEHANVQPHSGSTANMAAYFAVLQPGDTLMAMSLPHGGHLTHGHPMNFSGALYNVVSYGVSPETEQIDYDAVDALARQHRPKLIVAGASAYPRVLDFERFRAIADGVNALLMVDMAHIAGLVAGGVHPNPFPYADLVTSTTHKTLRGPRSGMVFCREAHAAELDKQVFPGLQGGPLVHTIAAKAVCFHEALQPEFKTYAAQTVANACALADSLSAAGLRIVSGGSDNHLILVDLTPWSLTGKVAAAALERAGIVCNKNAIPFDKQSPFVTSGIRLGTPAATTRGLNASDMAAISEMIVTVLRNPDDDPTLAAVKERVEQLCSLHPVP